MLLYSTLPLHYLCFFYSPSSKSDLLSKFSLFLRSRFLSNCKELLVVDTPSSSSSSSFIMATSHDRKDVLDKVLVKFNNVVFDKYSEFDADWTQHMLWLKEIMPETLKSFSSYPFVHFFSFSFPLALLCFESTIHNCKCFIYWTYYNIYSPSRNIL